MKIYFVYDLICYVAIIYETVEYKLKSLPFPSRITVIFCLACQLFRLSLGLLSCMRWFSIRPRFPRPAHHLD